AALVGAGFWLFGSADPVNPATYERVLLGMEFHEVEPVVGVPPGNWNDWRPDSFVMLAEQGTLDRFARFEQWWGNSYVIAATFDRDGRLQWKRLYKSVPGKPTVIERFRAWLSGESQGQKEGKDGK